MSDLYAIVDLEGYATQIREAAAKSICDTSTDNLNEYITLTQIINMVKTDCKGFDEEDRPLLDEDTNEKIFEDTAVWIHSVGLAKLAAQDLIECAWDDKNNEMVFWTKQKENNETKSKHSGKNSKSKRQDR
jgi:hypothetical protein